MARIKYDGTIQTEAFTAGSSGVQTSGNLNGVYSPDGNKFYISGANGVSYFSSFAPSAALVAGHRYHRFHLVHRDRPGKRQQ